MRKSRSIHSAAHHHLNPLRGRGHPGGFLENRDDPKLAARIFRVHVIHVGLCVPDERRIVIKPFRGHYADLLPIQPESMFDGVAARDDRVLLPLTAVHMAACFPSQPVCFLNQCLKNLQRIG